MPCTKKAKTLHLGRQSLNIKERKKTWMTTSLEPMDRFQNTFYHDPVPKLLQQFHSTDQDGNQSY